MEVEECLRQSIAVNATLNQLLLPTKRYTAIGVLHGYAASIDQQQPVSIEFQQHSGSTSIKYSSENIERFPETSSRLSTCCRIQCDGLGMKSSAQEL